MAVPEGTEREQTVHEKLNLIEDQAKELRSFTTNLRRDVSGPSPEPPTSPNKELRAESLQAQLDRITSVLRDALGAAHRANQSIGTNAQQPEVGGSLAKAANY